MVLGVYINYRLTNKNFQKTKGMDWFSIHPFSHSELPAICPFQLFRAPLNRLFGVPALDRLGEGVYYDVL